MTVEAELFDGTILEFPDGTDPAVVARVAKEQTLRRRQEGSAASGPTSDPWAAFPDAHDNSQDPWAAFPDADGDHSGGTSKPMPHNPAGPVSFSGMANSLESLLGIGGTEQASTIPQPAPPERSWGDWALGLGASAADGIREGVSSVVGAPVDLVNNAPRLANLLPGIDGVGPITDNPVGGGASIDALLRIGGLVPDYEPTGMGERIVNRVGQELGATAVPVGGAIAKAASLPVREVTRMAANPRTIGESISSMLLHPAAVNPVGLAGREGAYATAAGLGAGVANEAADTFGQKGPWSDFLGSLGGASTLALGSGVTGVLRNLFAVARGAPDAMDDVARSAVVERLINNSTTMQHQHATTGSLDTQAVVDALRNPPAAEMEIPGYRANIGDRARDPGLTAFAFDQDARSGGSATARRSANDAAVNARMSEIAPAGDPGRLRADIQNGVDAKIAQAVTAEDVARAAFDAQRDALTPSLGTATVRGSSIRSGLQDAKDAVMDQVRQLYEPINTSSAQVDVGPLRDRFAAIDQTLPLNDASRFRPSEADIPGKLAPAEAASSSAVPLNEVTAMRSGLTDDIRAQRAAGQGQAARVGSRYRDAIDQFTDSAVPTDLRAQLDTARNARRDAADRFERPGTGISEALRPGEGSGYRKDDSAIPGLFAQPNQGRLADLKALLSEAGADPRVRNGLADEVKSDVLSRGLVDKPAALGAYMGERSVLLSEFPELRQALEAAGASRSDLAAAERTARDTTARLTTPGRSAEASYLKHVEDPAVALRAAIRGADPRSADPRKAVADLVATAGTPTAKADLRSVFWEEVKRSGKLAAPGVSGEIRWNAKKVLSDLFNHPTYKAVAEELWADNPEDLSSIKKVFEALATAEGSGRAGTPGASSTGRAVTGSFDPALTSSSIASRLRSVHRGQLSPTIAAVDLLGTWLRRKSAQMQSQTIERLTSMVVNNPGMAADLLERYNPANAKAWRSMIFQKYGVRGTQLLNLLDGAEDDNPVTEAVGGR